MKFLVLAVGRPDRGACGRLFDDYADRIRKLGVPFEARFVPDVKPGGRFSDAHVMEREARALRQALPERRHVIALSPGGRTMTTEAFAKELARWSHPLAAFVLGGPFGLDPAFIAAADGCWSLSALTLPHELARVLVAEQLYRAVTLQRGIPYHKASGA